MSGPRGRSSPSFQVSRPSSRRAAADHATITNTILKSRSGAKRAVILPAITPARTGSHHRSEERTSELQSRQYLVCRLLLEKKKQKKKEKEIKKNKKEKNDEIYSQYNK